MYKLNVYNIIFDIRDFAKSNFGKFLIIAIVNLVGIIFGIKTGLSIASPSGYLVAHPTNDFLLAVHERGAIAYCFLNIFYAVIIIALLTLFSANFLLSYLCFALLFFRAYSFAMNLCLYICVFKLTVLPFVLVCVLPMFLLCAVIFAAVAVMSLCRAEELRKFGSGCNNTLKNYAMKMVIPCTMSIILCIFITIPAYFLTVGIIL